VNNKKKGKNRSAAGKTQKRKGRVGDDRFEARKRNDSGGKGCSGVGETRAVEGKTGGWCPKKKNVVRALGHKEEGLRS